MIDRLLFAAALLAAGATVCFALTRTTCPYCRNRYGGWLALQRHIHLAHRD